jgi:hypothetical protein
MTWTIVQMLQQVLQHRHFFLRPQCSMIYFLVHDCHQPNVEPNCQIESDQHQQMADKLKMYFQIHLDKAHITVQKQQCQQSLVEITIGQILVKCVTSDSAALRFN